MISNIFKSMPDWIRYLLMVTLLKKHYFNHLLFKKLYLSSKLNLSMASNHKVLSIVGARPQFVKATMLSNAWKKVSDFEEIIVHGDNIMTEVMSEVFSSKWAYPNQNITFKLGH